MLMTYVLFIIGFPVLIKGADILISGSTSLARRLGMPDVIIGLTIIAFGTSAPELFVNIVSSIKGTAQIAIGNILGSNIFNIFIVLGISAIVQPLTSEGRAARREIPLNLIAILVLGFLANEALIKDAGHSYLSRFDGFLMLGLFVITFLYLLESIKTRHEEKNKKKPIDHHGISKAILFIIFGLGGLLFGADWIVAGAVAIAEQLGWSQFLISSTIIAGGTSLPELAASVAAVTKKESGIAVGNVIGSNIFNIFFILGLSAVIRPLPVVKSINIDIGVAVLASALLLIALLIGIKKDRLMNRWHGGFFVLLYAAYVTFLIIRG